MLHVNAPSLISLNLNAEHYHHVGMYMHTCTCVCLHVCVRALHQANCGAGNGAGVAAATADGTATRPRHNLGLTCNSTPPRNMHYGVTGRTPQPDCWGRVVGFASQAIYCHCRENTADGSLQYISDVCEWGDCIKDGASDGRCCIVSTYASCGILIYPPQFFLLTHVSGAQNHAL